MAWRLKLPGLKGSISVSILLVSIAAIQLSLLEALLSVLAALAEPVAGSLPKPGKQPTAIQMHFTIGDSRQQRKPTKQNLSGALSQQSRYWTGYSKVS